MATAHALPNEQPIVAAPAISLPLEMARALAVPLPPEAIKPHPTKDYLSSVKAIYVIERLNDVFGIGGWTYKTQVIECSPDSPMVVMLVMFKVPAYGIRLEQYGGSDNKDRGDAYKGATTDGLTKCASYLGIAMDVYKGGGPTKANPRGMQIARKPTRHTPAQQAVVNAKLAPVGRQPAAAIVEQIPEEHEEGEVYYEEAPDQPTIEEQLEYSLQAERQKRIDAFGALKARYTAIGFTRTYAAVLGMYGAKTPADFPDTPEGLAQARKCFCDMREDVRSREVRGR